MALEHLIIKYINKEISKEELASLKEGLRDPEVRRQLEDYLELEGAIQLGIRDIDPDKIYGQLEVLLTPEPGVRKIAVGRSFLKYAAAVVLLVALAASAALFLSPGEEQLPPDNIITLRLEDGSVKKFDEEQPVISAADFAVPRHTQNTKKTASAGYNEINVPYGKRATIRLSDESQVVLNSGSVLKYPSAFDGTDLRKVLLEGEGYFIVTKNPGKPFVVETRGMHVKVLGTEFNLSCFNDDNQIEAVLVEGSISAESTISGTSVVVSPGEAAILRRETLSVRKVNIQKHTAWLHGDLLFMDDTFETVLKKLERHYNVEIVNEDPSLNEVHYNGRFDTETVEEVLEAFKVNTPLEYSVEKNKIIVKRQAPMK
ncbi:FecR family protein [Sinomicrobium soli]|uniref:FecR family protein n=1 Tax=Sinomicrobium sp. N-1-3-6 TaxID=2219864 RepID=UPI000DCB9285|nr:FecR domain-containing protein [Sinomicrobium sp. N-1-3-6]RAV27935.1 hypothetical protein DN748_16170 [Sinomicrobium sp. N-1-3-6]